MIIYNQFWFPGKVPSLNELNDFRGVQGGIARSSIIMRQSSKKVKRGKVFNLYNIKKQDWTKKVVSEVKKQKFTSVPSAYFSYLMIEKNKKRDPSNISSAAIKFIEDGIIKAGAIDNDGWKHVLGINIEWMEFKELKEQGVFVCMSSEPMSFFEICSHFALNMGGAINFNMRERYFCRYDEGY